MGAIKKLLILFIVVGCFAFTGCGNEPKQPPKDEVTQRIEAEFESFNRECKIVCVNRYCMNLLYAPYWGKQR
jgi:PBP1b-binding outer membrane lipoprotein LpoB